MPELPEVETGRRLAEKHIAGKRIAKVHTVNDPIVYHDVAPQTFARALAGRRVEAVCRKGKQLWMELDDRPWPGFHFGMTGSFHVYHDKSNRPSFWKVEICTEDGSRLAMRNVRRLGRLRLYMDPWQESPVKDLGFDPLIKIPRAAELRRLLQQRETPIKSLLLNQSFAAGVGNWVADEVLYLARINPHRNASSLRLPEISLLRKSLKQVIGKAVNVEADSHRFPRTWLFHHRWGKDSDAKSSCGNPICFDTIGGRTTAWVPSRQA